MSSLPFTDEQIAAVTRVCNDYEAAADSELAARVLATLAEHMERDEQHAGMFGPLRAWRVAGPWQRAGGSAR